MVLRLDPDNCHCGICRGGERAPPGYFGGTFCPCQCHSLTGKKLEAFVAKREAQFKSTLEKLVAEAFDKEPRT